MGTWSETKEHVGRAINSLTGSRTQTATALAALALPAILSPTAAAASAAAAGALLFARSRMLRLSFATTASRHEETYPIGTMEDGTPVALNAQQMNSGMLVYGTTGSGRTEALLGIAQGMLAKGSGMIFVDGRGDVSVYANIFVMAAAFGREDDVLVVKPAIHGGANLAHTFNPLQTGNLEQLKILINDLMEPKQTDSYWHSRTTILTHLVLEALIFRRDAGNATIDAEVFCDAFDLENVLSLVEDRELPESLKHRACEYLRMLPGFQRERGPKQAQSTLEHHLYLKMYAMKALSTLTEVGWMTSAGQQVDLEDVLHNNRILCIMLPSLDRSPLQADICTKAVLASLRMAMTSSAKVSTVDYTTGRSKPFPIILNDVGCGTSHSLMAIACEASSLGLSMIYGFQDEHCPSRLCGETGTNIVRNAHVKIQLSSQTEGRMTVQCGDASQNLAAPLPCTHLRSDQTRAFKNTAYLAPADLVPLTMCAAD